MDQSAVADRLHGHASCGSAAAFRVFTETIRGDRLKERSQNCRVVEAGRYFCEIVQSGPLLGARPAGAVFSTRSRQVLKISRKEDSTASLENLHQCLTTLAA